MKFPESFFEDEVREGFFVPAMMKRTWAAQIEVLNAIGQVCKRLGISCYADWGTVLGAVRHGGMVPWDDDIDLCMKRKDYERFLELAPMELPSGFYIESYRNSDTDNMVSKIVSYPIPLVSEEDLPRFHGYPYAVMIDLFVMDFLPPNPDGQQALWELMELVCEVNAHIDIGLEDREDVSKSIRGIEQVCRAHFDPDKPIKRQIAQAVENMAAQFDEEISNELSLLGVFWSSNKGYKLPKEYYEHTVDIPFENTKITVPAYYDAALVKKYGSSWMKPVRSGGSHDYPAYERFYDKVRDKLHIEPRHYVYSREKMEEVAAGRSHKKALKDRVADFLPLFREAHGELGQLIGQGRHDVAAGLLADCQDMAIQLGSLIEGELGEGHPTVALLVQYCEQIFCFHQDLCQNEANDFRLNIVNYTDMLLDYEKKLSESIEQDIKEKKKVVFLPYKEDYWKTMEPLWRETVADETVEVTVMSVPYYYRDDLGYAKKEEPHYETDYPEDVAITSYEAYNFETVHPDVIVTQYPFDEYNYALTVHPFFYAENLKKYTDNLVYVPPFVVDEIGPGDERARKTMKELSNTPGVVYADTVLVQSEQMKEVYVEHLTEFAGEDTKPMWEEKIAAYPPLLQAAQHKPLRTSGEKGVPEEWLAAIRRSDGSEKKVILYKMSASVLFQYGTEAVEKMKEVFDLFREHGEDIAVVWRPDPNARDLLRRAKPEAWPGYRDLMQEYRESGWGIYDDSPDAERAALFCDAYYGDGGVEANRCHVLKKPVMIQNVGIRGGG